MTLLLAWVLGGQMTLGRIDPALALPLLPLPALGLVWWQRRDPMVACWRTAGTTLAMLLAAQAALALFLSARPPWLQLGFIAAGWVIALLAASLLFTGNRGRVVALLLGVTFVSGWFAGSHALLSMLYRPASAAGPHVTMLTGLPLRWSDGRDLAAMLAQGTNDDPILARLQAAGSVRLVDSIVDDPPSPGGALLLAHPRALAPREMVAVDAFVRKGGRAVVLADALSGWPMRYPIGDPRNPPVTSLLTPLLDHWGVVLAAVSPDDRHVVTVEMERARLRLFSAGRFERLPPACRAFADRHVARCPIGDGEVWLVGDADLLFAPLWRPEPSWAAHLRKADTVEWLAARLWRDAPSAILQPLWIR
jgi:hypothetical protein